MRIICYLKLLLFTNYTSTFKSVCNHEFYHTAQEKSHVNIHERSRIKFFKKTQISYQLKKQNHGQNHSFSESMPSCNSFCPQLCSSTSSPFCETRCSHSSAGSSGFCQIPLGCPQLKGSGMIKNCRVILPSTSKKLLEKTIKNITSNEPNQQCCG